MSKIVEPPMNKPFPAKTGARSHLLSSRFVKTYAARYQNFQAQALKRFRHPFLPWILVIGLSGWVGVSLLQIWLRLQPVLTAHELSQEIQIYQNLLEQKKRLVLELSQQRSKWYGAAQEQFHMIYPTEFILLPSLSIPLPSKKGSVSP